AGRGRDPVRYRRRVVRAGAERRPREGGAAGAPRPGPGPGARAVPVGRGPPLPRIEAWASLPVGVVTLAERHGGHQVTRDIYEAMVAEVAVSVERFVSAGGGRGIDHAHMLGTS